MKIFSATVYLIIATSYLAFAQEPFISGAELSFDQDRIADWMREAPKEDDNYTVAFRGGIYGELADHNYLGLPWVRRKIDGFILDRILDKTKFITTEASHNFVFTVNGASPAFISDQTQLFQDTLNNGYTPLQDRPFGSFTGFRSTRRLEGIKRFVHTAYQTDMAVTSSITFGLGSLGWAKGWDDLLGAGRPEGVLWEVQDSVTYSSGQVRPKALPLIMYSLIAEAAVFQPLRKVIIQARPEIHLGYKTNLGIGVDIGKVMNVEKIVDNLGYTDTHNPSVLKVNNESIALAISAGGTVRTVFRNATLNGIYRRGAANHISFKDMRKFIAEAYVGVKVQLLSKAEISLSYNWRTSEHRLANAKSHTWGTIGLKYLIGPEDEGCYDL